jgi:hypothetical protein
MCRVYGTLIDCFQITWMILAIGIPVCRTAAAQTAYPCKTATPCLTVRSSVAPMAVGQGWIVGEVRAFAFGGDSQKLIDELGRQGWVECAGQSAIRNDFDELWKVIGTDWGSADRTNVFYLPDLRGLFLRGWNHGRQAPVNYPKPPFQGDRDLAARIAPRPEAGDAGGISGSVDTSTGQFAPDHVGSVQADRVASHVHPYQYTSYRNAYHLANDDHTTQNILGDGYNPTGTTGNPDVGGPENHPTNTYVTYMIYMGRPASSILASPEEIKKGLTGRVVRFSAKTGTAQ